MSQIIVSGGTTFVTTVDSNSYLIETNDPYAGATLDILDGGAVTGPITVGQYATLIVSSGGTALNTTVNLRGSVLVASGGTSLNTTINGGYYWGGTKRLIAAGPRAARRSATTAVRTMEGRRSVRRSTMAAHSTSGTVEQPAARQSVMAASRR